MKIKVVCSEKSISTEAGEPRDKNLYDRWTTFLTTALKFLCPEATVEVAVKPDKGGVRVTTYDKELSNQLAATVLRLLDYWVIGKDRKIVPMYEIRVPGQAAWEENIPTFEEAERSQKAAANQGIDADINVVIGDVHLSII